jgi:hypothetical protein
MRPAPAGRPHPDRGVFISPVEPGAGQQPDRAAVESGMQPSNLSSVQPPGPFSPLVDQFGELRFHPGGQRRRLSSGGQPCPVRRH